MAHSVERELWSWKRTRDHYFKERGNPDNLTEDEAFCFWVVKNLQAQGIHPQNMTQEILLHSQMTEQAPLFEDLDDIDFVFIGLENKGFVERMNGEIH